MGQLQEKEALLAAGAGAMSAEEREALAEKERARAQQAAEKEKQRVEAAMAAERAKSADQLAALQAELQKASDGAAAACVGSSASTVPSLTSSAAGAGR